MTRSRVQVLLPLAIFAIAAAYYFFFRFFVTLIFTENDDSVMMMLANGDYDGTPTSYLVFINIYLGAILAALYSWTRDVDWYPALFLGILALSVALLVMRAWCRRATLTAVEAMLLFVSIAFVVVCTVQMQFTTVAGVAMGVGVWSVLTGPGRTGTILGAGLVALAFLLRFEAAVLALVVASAFLAAAALQREIALWRFGLLVSLCALGTGLHVTGQMQAREIAPLHQDFNVLRGQINDNPHAELKPEDLPPGLTPNQLDTILRFFADPNVTDVEDLRALRAVIGEREAGLGAAEFAAGLKITAGRRMVALVSVVALVMAFGAPSRLIFAARVAGLIALLACFTYVASTAVLKPRVVQVGSFALLVSLFHMPGLRTERVRQGIALLFIGILLYYLVRAPVHLGRNAEQRMADFVSQRTLATDWDGDVVAFDFRPQDARLFSSDYDGLEEKIHFKGWMVTHPSNGAFASFERLLEDDVVLFVHDDRLTMARDLVTQALSENYGISARAEVVAESGEFNLLKFRR